MATNVQIGVAIPQALQPGPVGIALLRRFLAESEASGYHSLWTQEQVVGGGPSLEPLTLLSYAAALTCRVALGVSVLVLPQHHPVHLAKRAATLDQLCDGRLLLGVGLGHPMHYPLFGVPNDRRVARFTEQIRIMKSLWTEARTSYSGCCFRLDDVPMEPKPVQKPHPKLWIGGAHPQALRRAVLYGDGWMGPGASTISEFAHCAAQIRGHLRELGRDRSGFSISKRVFVAIDDRANRARRRLEEWFQLYYGNSDLAARVSVWGSVAGVSERLAELVSAGATHLLLNPVFDEFATMQVLAPSTGRNVL